MPHVIERLEGDGKMLAGKWNSTGNTAMQLCFKP